MEHNVRYAIRLCDVKVPVKEMVPYISGFPLGMLIIFDGSRRLANLFPVFECQSYLTIVVEWKAFQKALGLTCQLDDHKTVVDYVKEKNKEKLTIKLVVFEPNLMQVLVPYYPIVTVNNKRLVRLDANHLTKKSNDGNDTITHVLRDMIEVFGWFDTL